MTILNDRQISVLCQTGEMITPWVPSNIKMEGQRKVISYGMGSFGYDIRLAGRFQIFTKNKTPNGNDYIVDPKGDNKKLSYEVSFDQAGTPLIMPPHSFALAESYERFNMPSDVVAICLGKSTYARCGLLVNVTPLEPGWEGVLTMELSNTTPLAMAVYPFEGIAQLLFFRGDRPKVTYADKAGKYQNQEGLTHARV